jgi:hypothetical protein
MTDDHQWPDDADLQRIIIWKIAHDLSRFYAAETQLNPSPFTVAPWGRAPESVTEPRRGRRSAAAEMGKDFKLMFYRLLGPE